MCASGILYPLRVSLRETDGDVDSLPLKGSILFHLISDHQTPQSDPPSRGRRYERSQLRLLRSLRLPASVLWMSEVRLTPMCRSQTQNGARPLACLSSPLTVHRSVLGARCSPPGQANRVQNKRVPKRSLSQYVVPPRRAAVPARHVHLQEQRIRISLQSS